ncbi:MAG: TIGR00730 family Rossman fold protein [Sterolibacteriaceae bacterium]|nr:TIGR00730 family Rossman fold protein [Sterolibacteriaceae bacterium]MBK9087092.1 TIGR00730 family Rossman fold protein [Sterolibacteriaceae bacterium]
MRRICVFCGSQVGGHPLYAAAATAVGTLLALRSIGLVYGGGKVGLMGVVADAALAAGGEVIGVIPERLMNRELGHGGVTDLRVVDSMHERKAMMSDLSDAFIALPGGYGTFEEFFEVVTWMQLGIHAKPCGLLNVGGYYDMLLALLDHAAGESFIRPQHRGLVLVDTEPAMLLQQLLDYRTPQIEKWLERDQT